MTATIGPASDIATAPTVLVVDDHELVRSALAATLRSYGINSHACPVTTPAGILAEALTHPPGLVLLDLDLGSGADGVPINGVDVVGRLRAAGWTVLVVSASAGRHLPQVAAAIAAGAVGQVHKSESLSTLVDVVRSAAAGHEIMGASERSAWIALDRTTRTVAERRTRLLGRLTTRERYVLHRLAEGQRAVDIAEASMVSVTTVRSQIHAILTKLDVSSQLGAVALLHGQDGA